MSQSSWTHGGVLVLGRTRWLTLRLCRVVTVQILKCIAQKMRSPHTDDEFATKNPSYWIKKAQGQGGKRGELSEI